MNDDSRKITKEQDVNDEGQPIYRPPEKITEPVKPFWKWIWLAVIILIILLWVFLYGYFSHHQTPYSAPLR